MISSYSRLTRLRLLSPHIRYTSTWSTLREDYKRDPSRIITYNDPLAFKVDGRVFKPDPGLLNPSDPLPFPQISGWDLTGKECTIPNDLESSVKLISLSLRGGLGYANSWTIPFENEFPNSSNVSIT